jgi:hypothetical protein
MQTAIASICASGRHSSRPESACCSETQA